MSKTEKFEIFLGTSPGLEDYLLEEALQAGFASPKTVIGGVVTQGDWSDVWRANLTLRGASKVLARIGEFRAFHLAQLDKRARKFPWGDVLNPDYSVKVEVVTNRKSKIYHAGAAIERLERAIYEELGAPIAASSPEADIIIKTRIDDNMVKLSVDSSGIGLHKRGHKQAMGKAPLRETMAALLLRACDYKGDETVLDPMCGSGTFLIEAAEISKNLMAGRSREFAFEKLASYEPAAIQAFKRNWKVRETVQHVYGADRNVKVIGFAKENAERAGVSEMCTFSPQPLSKLERPNCEPGLIMINPPYGARIGKKKDLYALYGEFGDIMREHFAGWRIGLVTSDTQLAKATKLPWLPTGTPITHGGLRVNLFRTKPLP
jgi:putative N6-adenine-specific DNA methylase